MAATASAPGGRTVRGFTMVEVIVAVAVVAVLASLAVPLMGVFQERARVEATEKEMRNVGKALVAHYDDFGSFPADLGVLEARGYLGGSAGIADAARDSWERDYEYTHAGMTAKIVSLGPDAVASTPDDIQLAVSARADARRETREEMQTIHEALRNYERRRVVGGLPSLPQQWGSQGSTDGALAMLVQEGLLPAEDPYLADAWGDGYQYGGSPEVFVWSFHVGPEGPGGGDGGDGHDDGGGDDDGDDHGGGDDGHDESDGHDDDD